MSRSHVLRADAAPAILGALLAAALVIAAVLAVPARAQEPAANVEVFNIGYTPEEVTIEVGQTVLWTGTGGTHTVTSDDGTTFDSGTFGTGETFEFTFAEAGTYEYFCEIHSSADGTAQNGVVNVVAAGEGPTEEPTEAPTDEPTDQPTDTPTEEPATGDPADVDGTDTVATALSWSALLADGSTTTAFIGRSGDFPDSLASGPGQGILDAPLLLTPSDSLDDAVAAELVRLGVTRVIILGGPVAISADVEAAIGQVEGVQTVDRAAGDTRLETSRAVADLVAPDATTVLLARAGGEGTAAFADSLAAGAVGASNGWPVVLVGNSVDEGLSAWLMSRMPQQIILAGGTAAIPQAVEDQLEGAGYTVQRFAGPDRISTAANLGSLISADDTGLPKIIVDGSGDLAWASGFAAALHGQGGILLGRASNDAIPGDTASVLLNRGPGVVCGPTISDAACRQANLLAEANPVVSDAVAVMDNAQEVDPEPVNASGAASLFTVGDAFCLDAATNGLSGPVVAAHVHQGAFGEAGGVVMGILGSGGSDQGRYIGCTDAEASATAAEVLASPDDYYVNLHTELNPGGEIRGQVFIQGAGTLTAALTGAAEPDGGDETATGFATVFDTGIADQLCAYVAVNDLSPAANEAHIHQAPEGEAGPVVFPLPFPTADGTAWSCTRGNDVEDLAGVFATPADFYVNVHNETFPAGAIRGQLAVAPAE